MSEPALRERRRRQTEREIADAALDLFERQGVDRTTVDDIARAAGISPRTFFRYFATKEAAALVPHVALDERVERMLAEIGPGRPLLDQLEEVWREVLTAFDDGRSEAGRLMLRVRRLMLAEPALRQAAATLDARRLDDLVARVTSALGLDDDLGPRLAIEASGLAVRVALDRWADAREAGRASDLLETYAGASRHLRTLGG
ncbi:AcrR family transcriptional regulator [Nocardioides cavernae]|uniref:AcrR family transcriptional regulator n=1 Tax=Nocardioides cavernae TaxID=1921566 RepID=A0A7Y9KPI3_9ACTN|nr:TetR family transcriptional regulator [Nocardioides cavernae]NYE36746.1 AcrR family transcriptional regulator [Nocardioides cavernae]